jgi:hypothetical protein
MWGANPLQVAHKLGVSFGTIFKYCKCVVCALRVLGLQSMTWGDNECHEVVSNYIFDHYGIPDCVGILDGSLIRLTEMPENNGFSFICRKKYPAVSTQVFIIEFVLTLARSIFRLLLTIINASFGLGWLCNGCHNVEVVIHLAS